MKKSNFFQIFSGILLVSILGSLMHFAYDWSRQNPIIGLFAATNESTWEHMKLIFFPMLLYACLESYFMPRLHSFLPNKAAIGIGLLAGTWAIPVLFYTYSGILGFHIPILDISTFFISVFLAFAIRSKCKKTGRCTKYTLPVQILILLMCAFFFLFTYNPPELGIFISPIQ